MILIPVKVVHAEPLPKDDFYLHAWSSFPAVPLTHVLQFQSVPTDSMQLPQIECICMCVAPSCVKRSNYDNNLGLLSKDKDRSIINNICILNSNEFLWLCLTCSAQSAQCVTLSHNELLVTLLGSSFAWWTHSPIVLRLMNELLEQDGTAPPPRWGVTLLGSAPVSAGDRGPGLYRCVGGHVSPSEAARAAPRWLCVTILAANSRHSCCPLCTDTHSGLIFYNLQ